MKIKVKKNREQSVSRTQVSVVRSGDSCRWWMSSVWVGTTGGPVHRCPGKRHTGASNLGKQMQAEALPPQCCLHISLPGLSSIPLHAAYYFLLKNIFTLCLCCQLHVLFMLSWWCISELILPSRKMKPLINFPLYSLEQNYTGLWACYTRGSEIGVNAAT